MANYAPSDSAPIAAKNEVTLIPNLPNAIIPIKTTMIILIVEAIELKSVTSSFFFRHKRSSSAHFTSHAYTHQHNEQGTNYLEVITYENSINI